MLIIALTAITTTNAQKSAVKVNANTPDNVIHQLNTMIKTFGKPENQVYSVVKNPNTNIIESSERIVHFVAKTKPAANITLPNPAEAIGSAFMKDEKKCYQILHIAPGSSDMFSIQKVTSNSNSKVKVRTKKEQEMWYMATKNPDNPLLRDAYAIVWEEWPNGDIDGDIFMITSSLRPDIYQQGIEKTSRTFKLDGYMGNDNKDSLYIFYMAETYEELNRLTMRTHSFEELQSLMENDPEFIGKIALMPVINGHFEMSADIDKRMVGRQRTVMPDGSLCKLWVNLDMVPGETYHLVTHNGFFNEDKAYELRVGRYSGQSMIAGHDNDDVELTGGYNDDVTVADNVVVDGEWHGATENPLANLTPAQQQVCMIKAEEIQKRMEIVKELYGRIQNGEDALFYQVIKENEQIDKLFKDFLNTLSKFNVKKDRTDLYKAIVEFYAKQSKAINEFFYNYYYSSDAKKCQKAVNKFMEKYSKEMVQNLLP